MQLRQFLFGALALGLLAATPPARAGGPEVFALTEVRIVVAPGQVIEKGTVVLRDGVIEAVGAEITPPADARVLERAELTVYPGLIDAYVESKWPQSEGEIRDGAHDNSLVRPERRMALHGLDSATTEKLRGAGFTTVAVAPQEGLLRGHSAVVNLGDGGVNQNLLRDEHAQNVTFARKARGKGYPSSLMGSIALLRQTLLDARWHERAWASYDAEPAQKRPPMNSAFADLADVANGRELVVIEGEDALGALRSASLIREFGLRAHLVGSGDEYRWLDEISVIGVPLIVPLDFPQVPNVPEEDDLVLSLEDLRHWDRAPRNPKALLDAGNTVAITSHRLEAPGDVLKNLYLAIDRGGLSSDEALAALTTTPARLLGIDDRAGTVEVGKMANLVLAEGELFAEKPSLREVWVDGRRFEVKDSKPPAIEPAGTWELTMTTGDSDTLPAVMILEGNAKNLSGTVTDPEGNRIPLSRAEVSGERLEVVFDGTAHGTPGDIEFHLDIKGDSGTGHGTSPTGSFTIKGTRSTEPTEVTR
ncbi:MAG: amidohydrolase family protein [bacterium]|nr:amidohydrolase family protein [bacterium]